VRKEPYSYDAVDQIIGVQYITNNVTTRTVSYEYDPVGNRSQVTEDGTPIGYTANNLNQYTVVDGATLGYDANGNLASASGPPPLGNATAQYDAQNRLVSASGGPSSVTATFAYDARNRCVARTINDVTTYLIYDGWSLIEERDATGTQIARYIHGATIDEILCRTTSGATHYFHHDGLGSTIALTDSTGALLEAYTYDVFGLPSFWDAAGNSLPSSLFAQRFLFTGREYLADLTLYDYRNRFYSPVLGRFLQTDPITFAAKDLNLYRYVRNSTLIFVDPMGLRTWFAGVEGNFYGMFGGEISAGSYVDTSNESFDIGGYVTGGWGVGYNVSAGVTAGWINGDVNSFRGEAMNFTAGVPYVSVTRIIDPNSPGDFFGWKPVGWSFSVGPGPTPVAVSISKVWTKVLSGKEYIEKQLNDWLRRLLRRIGGKHKQ